MLAALILFILPLSLAFAAFTDLFTMSIPNRVPIFLLIAFFVIVPFTEANWSFVGMSFVAGLIVFAVGFALFALNTMGGGDVKLLSASALWFGFDFSLALYMLAVAVTGGFLTVVILLLRSRSQEIMASGLPIPDSLLVARKVPYGIAIAIAGLLTYPEAPIVQAAMRSLY